jgi:hypothetical protein
MDPSVGGADVIEQVWRQLNEAFWAYPHPVMAVVSIGLAAIIVAGFWAMRGSVQGVRSARLALRAQALRNQKDHRAMVLVGGFTGPGGARLREELIEAIQKNFGDFAFQAPVQVEQIPLKLPVVAENAPNGLRRKIAAAAVEGLEKCAGDVVIWGHRGFGGKVEVRMVTPPLPNQLEEMHPISFKWRPGQALGGYGEAVTYASARRARPVLNKPQDYKPEKLQPIVEALDGLVTNPPETLNDVARLEILSDFASGALSLGERGGETGWLVKALDARRQFLDRVDRTTDPAAWGRAQQEVGRALVALGEREADRAKLEEGVGILKTSIDALRATDSLQSAEVAMRALGRAEQTLAARKRIGLRWPV